MSENYWKYATQSDEITPIGGNHWRGDWPEKMRIVYNIPYGDGPLENPSPYVFQSGLLTDNKPIVLDNNAANYDNVARWTVQSDGTLSTGGDVTTVGSNGRPSSYGTYDQSGNVWEWIYTATPQAYRIRGGSYKSNSAGPSKEFGPGSRPGLLNDRERFPSESLGFRIATRNNIHDFPSLVVSPGENGASALSRSLEKPYFVRVGDINNPAYPHIRSSTGGFGSVSYSFQIGRFPVTNVEYIEFLNAVATREDKYGLFRDIDNTSTGIIRVAAGARFNRYRLKNFSYRDKPVVHIEWSQAARFCNWLHNNKPGGLQDENTTEDGAYTLNGAFSTSNIISKVGGQIFSIDKDQRLVVNSTPVLLQNNRVPIQPGLPWNRTVWGNWEPMAAGSIGGVNTIVWKYKPNGFLHLWKLDSLWNHVSSEGWFDPDNVNNLDGKTFSDIENDFSMSFSTPIQPSIISPNADALYYIPTEDEWYKAAYYKRNPVGEYWNFATASDVAPQRSEPLLDGDGPFDTQYYFVPKQILPPAITDDDTDDDDPPIDSNIGSNSINYNLTAGWGGLNSNVTTVGTNGGPSYYGTYDQSGNVPEWVVPGPGRPSTSPGILRGGAFNSNPGLEFPIHSKYVCSSWDRSVGGSSLGGIRLVYNGSDIKENFVLVENIENANDSRWTTLKRYENVFTGGQDYFADWEYFGQVNYAYQIGKYPVTVCEYVEFLNAAAKTDKGAYDRSMSGAGSRVRRSGRNNSYTYSFDASYAKKPMQRLSLSNVIKYCNWLSYGKPDLPPVRDIFDVDITTGRNSQDQQIGVYVFRSQNTLGGPAFERNLNFGVGISGDRLEEALPEDHEFPDADNIYLIPNEDEWYKAAFYNPETLLYSLYATQSETAPTPVFALTNGDGSLDRINPVQETTFEC